MKVEGVTGAGRTPLHMLHAVEMHNVVMNSRRRSRSRMEEFVSELDERHGSRSLLRPTDGGVMALYMAALNGHIDSLQLLGDLRASENEATMEDGTTIDLIQHNHPVQEAYPPQGYNSKAAATPPLVNLLMENNVVDTSLTVELETYKEQVELYERRARFELTKKEQKIDEQLSIFITDCNIKEEILKKELHSVKMQLSSTINHNKSMVDSGKLFATPDLLIGRRSMLLMQAHENRVALDEEQLLFIAGGQDNVVDKDVDEQPVQDLALNVDNVFQADDCDAFNSDVDEPSTAQTMFMANLSSVDHVCDEAGPSYNSDILSEVHDHDHDHYQDVVNEHHEVHEMHDDVQPNYVVDSHADYTSDSNMIPYDQQADAIDLSNGVSNLASSTISRKPTIFTLGEQVPLTRFTQTKVVPAKQPENVSTSKIVVTENLSHTSQKPLTRYQRRNKLNKAVPAGIPTPTDTSMEPIVVSANLLDSNNNWGSNCPNSPSLSVFKCRSYRSSFVRFGNDHFGAIIGYGDYVIGDSMISRVCYVEGLGHNLFFVGQFCDSDLEVAFRYDEVLPNLVVVVQSLKDLIMVVASSF
nr:E3 ubiquitin-protein ligase XBAT32 isoform X1 [Tanacetum cinerariifolium]